MASRWFVVAWCLFVVLPGAVAAQPAKPPAPKDGPLGMKFVPLPKATFFMGWDGEKKGKKTEIKEAFEIAIHTVTQGQWQELMKNNPSWYSRNGDEKDAVKDIPDADLKLFPVEGVSWHDAQKFIDKLNEKEKGKGYEYRLPTSAEWEYACRGGATSEEECSYHFYVAKPTNDLSSEHANFNGSFPFGKAPEGKDLGRPTKVGSYVPNKLGLYDMNGNVTEWSADLYVEDGKTYRLSRGGSWNNAARAARAGYSFVALEGNRVSDQGFRLVRVPVR